MFLGRLQLGECCHVYVQTTDSSDVPALPADCPQLRVTNSAGTTVLNQKMHVVTPDEVTGLFHYPLTLDAAFSTGDYSLTITYGVSTHSGLEAFALTVLPGGDADGPVTSMYAYHRPQAEFVIHGLASGNIKRGRNPRVA